MRNPRMYMVKELYHFKSWEDMKNTLPKNTSDYKLQAWKDSEFFLENKEPFDNYIVFPRGTFFLLIDDDPKYFYGYIVDSMGRAVKVNDCKLYVCFDKETWEEEAATYFRYIFIETAT